MTSATLASSNTNNSSPVNNSGLNVSNNGHHQLVTNTITLNKPIATTNRPLLCIQSNGNQAVEAAVANPTQLPTTNGNFNTTIRIKDCIRLRGLPYEISNNVEQILEFLGEHSGLVVYQGIHLIYNLSGHFTGEAFLQMQNEYSASQAALAKHMKYMIFGKKQRYIEVMQCALDDMLIVLNGGQFFNSNYLLNGQMAMQRTLSECFSISLSN